MLSADCRVLSRPRIGAYKKKIYGNCENALSKGLKRALCNFRAPFLDKMSGVREFQRWWAVAYLFAKISHGRRTEHRVIHAYSHERLSFPFRLEPLARSTREIGSFSVSAVRNNLGKTAHACLVTDIR